jgi:hypothetical protein
MIDTLTNLSDCGMLSSGAGLGVARYLLGMVKYNQQVIREDEYRRHEMLRCRRMNVGQFSSYYIPNDLTGY